MPTRIPGKELFGQLFNVRSHHIPVPFTQQVQNTDVEGTAVPGYGQPGTEVIPIDANSATVKTFHLSALATTLLAETFSYPAHISFDLPPVLTALDIVYNGNNGSSSDNASGSGYATGDPFNLTLDATSRGGSSASILPELLPQIDTYVAKDVPVTVYEFWMPNNFTEADLLTRVSALAGGTVLAWPFFQPKALFFTLLGQSGSLNANASVRKSLYISDTNTTTSAIVDEGTGEERGVSVHSKDIQETLHGAFNLTTQTPPSTSTVTATASAAASWTGTGVFPSGTASSSPTALTLTAKVLPTMISATSPTDIPKTGLYLKDWHPEVDEYLSIIAVVATVIDMGMFA